MVILIIVTGDRYEGMKLSGIPGLILSQFIFGLFFIEGPWKIKPFLSLFVSLIIYGVVVLFMRKMRIHTNFDIYGFWDLVVANLISGLIIWEIYYHVQVIIKKRFLSK